MPTTRGRFLGCMLGGAVGDALGAPVEFTSYALMERPVREFLPCYGRRGAITDDTQMTLATADAVLNQYVDESLEEACWRAYRTWYAAQRGLEVPEGCWYDSAIMRASRAPGGTCLGALAGGVPGTMDAPLNSSPGCGGVMRVAPIGLAGEDPFEDACAAAALTHGSQRAYLPAGVLAAMLRWELRNFTVGQALVQELHRLRELDATGARALADYLETILDDWRHRRDRTDRSEPAAQVRVLRSDGVRLLCGRSVAGAGSHLHGRE